MKKIGTLMIGMMAVITLLSCKSEQNDNTKLIVAEKIPGEAPEQVAEGRILAALTSMNELGILTNKGDTLTFSTLKCKDNKKYFGSSIDGYIAHVTYLKKIDAGSSNIAKSVVILSNLLGSWVEPNPINASEVQGIQISNNGVASSINMHTLTYKKWKIADDKLLLTSVSEGSGEPTESTDTFNIASLSSDSLVLSYKKITLKYAKSRK